MLNTEAKRSSRSSRSESSYMLRFSAGHPVNGRHVRHVDSPIAAEAKDRIVVPTVVRSCKVVPLAGIAQP